MIKVQIIGNLGANAEKKNENGKLFTTFRVAHNERWTDGNGQEHHETHWVDAVLNDHPKVADYLVAGTTVYIEGNARLRVYSSAKDRCMKAGLTVSVRHIELIGGKADAVPSRLYDADGVMHNVTKWYLTDVPNTTLVTPQGKQFIVDGHGWVSPLQAQVAAAPAQDDLQMADTHDNTDADGGHDHAIF